MKKLLSFAINDYPGSQNDLRGCINDQNNVYVNLCDQFGFDGELFKNSQATKEKFRNELINIVNSAKNGDVIVIHYSGHGTQLPDKSGDEGPGNLYDEALYLYDGAFSDDEFTDILDDIEEGVVCVFIMDCCFSGTITRKINQKARFKPLFSEVDREGSTVERKHRKSIKRNAEMNHLVLTGCSEYETSADAYINGKFNGALTYCAMETLTDGISYKEWHRRLLKKIKASGYDQTPQLEGNDAMIELGVFGSSVEKKECFLLRWFKKKSNPKPVEPPKPPNPPGGH